MLNVAVECDECSFGIVGVGIEDLVGRVEVEEGSFLTEKKVPSFVDGWEYDDKSRKELVAARGVNVRLEERAGTCFEGLAPEIRTKSVEQGTYHRR